MPVAPGWAGRHGLWAVADIAKGSAMRVVDYLALDALVSGMKVAEAVVDKGGNVLVPAGAEITESMLSGLRRREVAGVKVEFEVAEDPALAEARRVATAASLDQIFRKAGDAPETRTLYQAVLNYRLENSQ